MLLCIVLCIFFLNFVLNLNNKNNYGDAYTIIKMIRERKRYFARQGKDFDKYSLVVGGYLRDRAPKSLRRRLCERSLLFEVSRRVFETNDNAQPSLCIAPSPLFPSFPPCNFSSQ